MLYQLMPTMPEHRLWPLIERFAEIWPGSRCSLRCLVQSENEGRPEGGPLGSAANHNPTQQQPPLSISFTRFSPTV
jgi:hypothetical protein